MRRELRALLFGRFAAGRGRVVYLDADPPLRDVAQLYDSKPEAVVAGVPRNQKACYDAKDQRPGMFFCENDDLGASPRVLPKTFNAGLSLLILKVARLEARRQVHRHDASARAEEALAPRVEPASGLTGARPLRGA